MIPFTTTTPSMRYDKPWFLFIHESLPFAGISMPPFALDSHSKNLVEMLPREHTHSFEQGEGTGGMIWKPNPDIST